MMNPMRRLSGRAVYAAVAIAVVGLIWLATALLIHDLSVSGLPGLPGLPELQGRPAGLVEHLRSADRAARHAPDSAEVVGRLGMAYHADTFADEALRCYARAQKLAPRDWRWHYYAALLHEEYGDSASVIQCLRATVALKPSFALAWLRLGHAAFKKEDLAAAEAAHRQALTHAQAVDGDRKSGDRSFGVSTYATYELARVALTQGRADEARAMLEELARQCPGFGPGHRLLSRVETQLGNAAAAEQARARAGLLGPYTPPSDPLVDGLARESHSASFLLKQFALAERAGRTGWMLELCRRAATVNDRDSDAQVLFGLLLLRDGQLSEAIAPFQAALRLRPEYALAHSNLGLTLMSLGRVPEAMDHLHEALRIEPTLVEARSNLGRALIEAGRIEEAIRQLEQALATKPSFAPAHYNLALAREQQGRLPAAIQHVEWALQLQPDYTPAHFLLAAILVQQGRAAEAIPHFEETLRLQSQHAEAPAQLAQALQQAGRLGEAAAMYEQILSSQPDVPGALNNLAWLRATAADPALRDGVAAVRLAERGVELTGRKAPADLDTLAAAYAEAGRLSDAVATAEEALALARTARQGPLSDAIAEHLETYRAGRPWREPAP
jgi:tetratricopeptide (TPR) repeat protein